MPNPNLMSHAESKLIVRWLRSEKGFADYAFPLDRFYKMSTEDIVKVIKKQTNEDISQLELLEATGRVVV